MSDLSEKYLHVCFNTSTQDVVQISLKIVLSKTKYWCYYVYPMVTLLDFWAPWCGPCKIMNPIIDELEKELGDKLKVDRINVDDDPAKSQQMGVMSIPTYIVMKDGKEIGRKVGITAKADLAKLLQS